MSNTKKLSRNFVVRKIYLTQKKKAKKTKAAQGKRIKLIKYNNKKLSNLEKVEKLKILSKVVRRYRRKIKNIRKKIKVNSERIWAKYLNKKLIKNKKNKKEKETLSVGNIILALKKVRNFDFDYEEDKLVLENMINLLASGKLRPDSVNYHILATQIRTLLGDDKIKHLIKDPKIYINFPEKEVYITKKELDFYKKAGSDESVFRAILGFKQEEVQEKGIYDHVLASYMNKNVCMDTDEFCNNLFNTDVYCNNVFIK